MFLEAITDEESENQNEAAGEKVLFSPPAWEQRRYFALAELRKHFSTVDWVLELGCGEGTLAHTLTNSSLLSRVSIVDSDCSLMPTLQTELVPRPYQYIARQERPLRLEIFNGCLTAKEPKLMGVHAIVMFEVIEHLNSDILEKVPEVVFGYYAPSLVLISTPNADYNVNFPGYVPGTFRHDDHKFEWTAAEFQKWGDECAEKYGYSVTYTGVARRPQDDCYSTQIAVFEHKRKQEQIKRWPISTGATDPPIEPHELVSWNMVATIDFPWEETPSRIVENTCCNPNPNTLETLKQLIPSSLHTYNSVSSLWNNRDVRNHFRSIEALRTALRNCPGITVTECSSADVKEYQILLGEEPGELLQFSTHE